MTLVRIGAALPGTLRTRPLARAAAITALAVLAAACDPATEPPGFQVQRDEGLLVQVVDSLYDAGRGVAVAIGPEGEPAISYLLLSPVLREGQIPPPVVAGQPQPPSVMLATQAEGIWTRTSVTPQPALAEEAVGSALEIANEEGQAEPGVSTDLAIDGQGNHHVVWSTPEGLFYSTGAGAGESFAEPERIVSSPAFGGSIAIGQAGAVVVSFYSGGSLRFAERSGQEWLLEELLRNAGPAARPAIRSEIGVGPDGEPIVAFGDHGRTIVARRSAAPGATSGWSQEAVPGEGGYGISMDLDAEGNPHLAYYDGQGNVRHAHSIGSARWEVTDIDSVGSPRDGDSDSRWGTGISLDDEGIHYVTWADSSENRIELATNQEGEFTSQPVNSGEGGTNPTIAVSGDGEILLMAWFDATNANLEVAETSRGELALAHPTERPAAPTGAPPAGECEPEGATELQISAPLGGYVDGFDKDCLAIEAGQAFSVEFVNDDAPQIHNWTLYADSSAAERLGGSQGTTDPVQAGQTVTYEVDPLDPGNYFFRCDFHPVTMTGSFVVPEE